MRNVVTFLLPYLKRRYYFFAPMFVFIVAGAIAQTYIPIQIRNIINDILVLDDRSAATELLIFSFFLLLGFTLFDWITGVFARYFNNRMNQTIQYDVRKDIFSKLQDQEMDYFANESIGQIMSRTIEEVNSLREVLGWGMRISILVTTLFIATLVTMIQVSPYLALFYVVIAPVILLILGQTSKRNAEIFYRTRFVYGEMNEVMAESYSGIKTIKSFGRERNQIEEFRDANNKFFDQVMKEINIRSTLQPMMIFLINIGLIIVVVIAGSLVQTPLLSPGDYVAFMLLTLNIATPGRFLGELAIGFQMADAAVKRINEVLESDVSIKSPENPVPFSEKVDIEFDNVSFRYPAGHVNTLDSIKLTIRQGEKVALLGPTGSGKTTLVNLIPRFFDVTDGAIKLGGEDIRNLDLEILRSHIGIVHQDSFLFTMSLRDNIAFGRPEATDEEIMTAAKIAQIHEFIHELPEGYDTMVGERGVTLSGGQRQRVSIARAVLTNPPILVFDDSVSAVDPETESRLQETLSELSDNRTVIVISQRPSSLKYVDRIIVLDEGRIVQDGSHSSLKDVSGIYHNFIRAVESQIQYIEWGQSQEESN